MTDVVLKLEDSRRLTGPNLFWADAGAIIDVSFANISANLIVTTWSEKLEKLFQALAWNQQKHNSRIYSGGISLVSTAPIDALYAATEINEAAWQLTVDELLGQPAKNSFDLLIKKLKQLIAAESNPPLIALQKAALERNICFLSDDDVISIGYGKTCLSYSVDDIPAADDIDWDSVECIPVALVTGTNGKSTSVRLASSVIKAAGKSCGITSTDYIRVGDEILDTGDYSGPGGARTLLRHPQTEVAFLEVARGGMLRRGIGVNKATAVLITNVAEDHLGEYGIDTLKDMVEAKFIVRQAISLQQDLIINADDSACVEFANTLENNIVWFSWDADNAVIKQHIQAGKTACYVDDGSIYYHYKGDKIAITEVNEIPITLSGAARHNIHNALGVVALCHALGIDKDSIAKGLSNFHSTPEDNPGRGNIFEFDGVKVIIDFAHNEHGMNSMAETLSNMPAKRRLVLLCQAGDRSDELIKGLVTSALSIKPDAVVICEIADYLRGRQLNEVPQLIRQFALEMGTDQDQIIMADSAYEGAQKALQWSQPGDVLLILALTQRAEIIDLLKARAGV